MIDADYEIPQDHRTLQISSALEFAAHTSVHESRLGSNEAEIRQRLQVRPRWVPEKAVLFDGYISILYQGQELLGPLWWIEFVSLAAVPVIEGGRSKQKLNNTSGQFVEFERSGPWVEMRLHDHGTIRKRPDLPFNEFVIEWGLMCLRTRRVGAELGGPGERLQFESYRNSGEFVNVQSQFHIPKRLLDYTAFAPLGEVLSNPVPQLD